MNTWSRSYAMPQPVDRILKLGCPGITRDSDQSMPQVPIRLRNFKRAVRRREVGYDQRLHRLEITHAHSNTRPPASL